jgi:tRNA threonylcarbamoyl adenosine modification protein YjeE
LNSKQQLIFEETYDSSQLPSLALRILNELLLTQARFVLWLQGELGAGKTTLVGHILRELGLTNQIPIQSPTFTYANSYEIQSKIYCHMDLYRLNGPIELFDFVGIEADDCHGLFIEWPQNLMDDHEILPSHKIELEFAESSDLRMIKLWAIESTIT